MNVVETSESTKASHASSDRAARTRERYPSAPTRLVHESTSSCTVVLKKIQTITVYTIVAMRNKSSPSWFTLAVVLDLAFRVSQAKRTQTNDSHPTSIRCRPTSALTTSRIDIHASSSLRFSSANVPLVTGPVSGVRESFRFDKFNELLSDSSGTAPFPRRENISERKASIISLLVDGGDS